MKINYCLVCLKYDVKLYSLRNYSFGDIYSDLTQILVTNWNQHVCFECGGLLQKYHQFKLRCIRTDKILSETIIMSKMEKIHLQTLQRSFNLTSNLGFTDVVTEDLIEKAESNTESYNLNNDGIFIYLTSDEERIPSYIDFTNNKCTQTDKTQDKVNKTHNSKILSVDISQNGKRIICGEDSNNPKTNGIRTNEPNVFRAQDKIINQGTVAPENAILILNNDNESCNSNYSWKPIFSTVNGIKYSKKEEVLNNKENVDNSLSEHEFDDVSPLDRKQIAEIEKSVGVKVKSITLLVSNKTKCTKPKKKKIRNIEQNAKIEIAACEQQEETLSKKQKMCSKKKFLKKHGIFEYMTQEQAKNDVLARKDSSNYRNSLFKCELCFRGYWSKETFDNHMNKHNSALRGELECDNCHLKFPTKRLFILRRHIAASHSWRFTCGYPQCSYVGYNIAKSINHVDLHRGMEKKYKCKYCDAKFNVENSLAGHVNKRHKDEFEVEVVCEFCGRIFYNEKGICIHKFKIHYNEKNSYQGPECKECNVHFASEQAWELHLVLSRKHEVANGCKQCGKRFESNYELALHMKEHRLVVRALNPKSDSTPESYVCHFCGFITTNDYFHKRHLHVMHGQPKPELSNKPKPYVCEICGDKYAASTLLRTHMWKHTGERPYSCQFCGKAFRLILSLRAHENLHTRAEVYKCGVCDREFLWKPSLMRHIRLHLGNTPYKCLECGQSFVNLCLLKAHVRHKHEKVPYPQRKNPRYKKRKIWEPVAEENIETSIIN